MFDSVIWTFPFLQTCFGIVHAKCWEQNALIENGESMANWWVEIDVPIIRCRYNTITICTQHSNFLNKYAVVFFNTPSVLKYNSFYSFFTSSLITYLSKKLCKISLLLLLIALLLIKVLYEWLRFNYICRIFLNKMGDQIYGQKVKQNIIWNKLSIS